VGQQNEDLTTCPSCKASLDPRRVIAYGEAEEVFAAGNDATMTHVYAELSCGSCLAVVGAHGWQAPPWDVSVTLPSSQVIRYKETLELAAKEDRLSEALADVRKPDHVSAQKMLATPELFAVVAEVWGRQLRVRADTLCGEPERRSSPLSAGPRPVRGAAKIRKERLANAVRHASEPGGFVPPSGEDAGVLLAGTRLGLRGLRADFRSLPDTSGFIGELVCTAPSWTGLGAVCVRPSDVERDE
jgi:hypothetical protein